MIAFFVPGPPRGKARIQGGRTTHFFKDKKTANYEGMVSMLAAEAAAGALLDGPVAMRIVATMAVAKSAPKVRALEMLMGVIWPTVKPDLDNLAKSIMDGCNGVAYGDDVQVCKLEMVKAYGETPGVAVTIWSL